jgi:hypothetical protein
VSGFNDFQKVTGFSFFQRKQKPFIQDKEFYLGVLFYQFPVGTISTGKSQVAEKVRKPDVPHGEKTATGGYT